MKLSPINKLFLRRSHPSVLPQKRKYLREEGAKRAARRIIEEEEYQKSLANELKKQRAESQS
tara:strand:- start:306 stop:491 length:186 start_codon:yes stop_codon:yes gene_type:complete